jgi:hypothetical protein
MDASLYSTTRTEVLNHVSYGEFEKGFSTGFLAYQHDKKDIVKEICLLDLIGDDLQILSQNRVDQCGYISLFMTKEIYIEVIKILEDHGLSAHIENMENKVDFSNPENFYFIQFS